MSNGYLGDLFGWFVLWGLIIVGLFWNFWLTAGLIVALVVIGVRYKLNNPTPEEQSARERCDKELDAMIERVGGKDNLDADEVWEWTWRKGRYSDDPRKITRAQPTARLRYAVSYVCPSCGWQWLEQRARVQGETCPACFENDVPPVGWHEVAK